MLDVNSTYTLQEHRPYIKHVPRTRSKTETFLHDGLLDSFVTEKEFETFGDESNNFRDFSLRSVISAEAVELLQPVGMLPYDRLRAADKLGTFVSSFDGFSQSVEDLKANIAAKQNEIAADIKTNVNE